MEKLELYKEAFIKHFDCKEEDFEMKRYHPLSDNYTMLVNYKGSAYKVCSLDDLYDMAESYLTDEMAMYLPSFIVREVMEEAHKKSEFYDKLLPKLDGEQRQELSLALSIYNISDAGFLEVLESCDPLLYAKAINSTSELYKLDYLKSDLVEELINNGKEVLNEITGGIFECVYLDEDSDDEDSFYIYNVDSIVFETAV